MARNVTLKDIAQHTGVSYQTVSKVISSQMQIAPNVRARIRAAIDELDYRPNAAIQNLRTQSSHLIGYSWKSDHQNHSSPILEQFQHSIVTCAEDLGCHILPFPQRTDHDVYMTFAE